MKGIVTLLIAAAMATFTATSASAHIVEVTTSIPVAEASSQADLKVAVASAVDDAIHRAVAFTPTAVTLQGVRRIGNRIYLQLLIVDQDGEALIKQLASDAANEVDEPSTDAGDKDGQTL